MIIKFLINYRFFQTVGLGAFIYHEKYMNKPQTLEDRFSSSDSDGSSVEDPYRRISQIDCVGFDTTRVTHFYRVPYFIEFEFIDTEFIEFRFIKLY